MLAFECVCFFQKLCIGVLKLKSLFCIIKCDIHRVYYNSSHCNICLIYTVKQKFCL